jgi:hypothetical protein
MTTPCIRRAWLVLGTSSVELEDPAAGYFCSALTLSSPDVRAVTSSRPDMDGIDDRTQFSGGRAVAANIDALEGAGARIDEVAASFGPYLVPSARPFLHYVLDRGTNPERVVGPLRGVSSAWPIAGDNSRNIQLQWIAADPVAYDPASKMATAWSGASVQSGRIYPLTFPRQYGGGTGGVEVDAVFSVVGDYPVQPLVRIYGPITGPYVRFIPYAMRFLSSFHLDAGQYVTIDTKHHAAYMGEDPTASVLSSVDWTLWAWPVLTAAMGPITMKLSGSNTNGLTQAQATWSEGYLS